MPLPVMGLWTMAIDEFMTKVSQRLSRSAMECSPLQVELVDDLSDVSPFAGLEISYLQSQYYAKHFHLLVIIMILQLIEADLLVSVISINI
jgi:hypothetical protein